MGFVFVLRRAAGRARASQLAKALKARGLDVCVGLENEPADMRSSVSRSMVDHCAVMVALWSDPDLTDAAFVEPMRYAASRGKLFAVSLDGAPLPANLGIASGARDNWSNDATAFEAICSAIVSWASQGTSPNEWAAASAFTAAEEYAAYNRVHKQVSVEAMARFLREFPGGMFEDIMRAELDEATRPGYEPSPPRPHEEPGAVWRMGTSPWSALQNMDPRWLWAGAAAVSVAVLALAAIKYGPSLQTTLADLTPPQRDRPTAQARVPAPSITLAPAAADAEPIVESADAGSTPQSNPEAPASTQIAALAPNAPAAEPPERTSPPTQAPPSNPSSSAAASPDITRPVELQLRPRTAEDAPLASVRPTQVSRPPETSASPSTGYDISALEPEMRSVVERARRNEVRGIAEALRRAGEGQAQDVAVRSNAPGAYRGEWSDNAANGLGRATWPNGDSYAGSWRASRPDGAGILHLAGGLRYEGEFSAGAPTGRGVFWDAQGRRLVGDRLFSALMSARTH